MLLTTFAISSPIYGAFQFKKVIFFLPLFFPLESCTFFIVKSDLKQTNKKKPISIFLLYFLTCQLNNSLKFKWVLGMFQITTTFLWKNVCFANYFKK